MASAFFGSGLSLCELLILFDAEGVEGSSVAFRFDSPDETVRLILGANDNLAAYSLPLWDPSSFGKACGAGAIDLVALYILSTSPPLKPGVQDVMLELHYPNI